MTELLAPPFSCDGDYSDSPVLPLTSGALAAFETALDLARTDPTRVTRDWYSFDYKRATYTANFLCHATLATGLKIRRFRDIERHRLEAQGYPDPPLDTATGLFLGTGHVLTATQRLGITHAETEHIAYCVPPTHAHLTQAVSDLLARRTQEQL